jgi:dTDP-4-amino-4,6-dideoxygalactose transaminase
MTTLTWDRHRGHASTYDVLLPGFNYRMDDIRASLALVQLGRLAEANVRRAVLAGAYVELLHGVDGIEVSFARRTDRSTSAHHLLVVVLPEGSDREGVRAELAAGGIQTSVHYPPIHGFTAYRDLPQRPLPRTEALAPRILTLPLYPTLTELQIEHVAQRLAAALRSPARAR